MEVPDRDFLDRRENLMSSAHSAPICEALAFDEQCNLLYQKLLTALAETMCLRKKLDSSKQPFSTAFYSQKILKKLFRQKKRDSRMQVQMHMRIIAWHSRLVGGKTVHLNLCVLLQARQTAVPARLSHMPLMSTRLELG